MYRCKHGVLDKCYGEGDMEPYSGKLDLRVEDWQSSPLLSLREAARLLYPQNAFHGGTCNCKSGCKGRRCACRQKCAPCSKKCHNGTACENCTFLDDIPTQEESHSACQVQAKTQKPVQLSCIRRNQQKIRERPSMKR